MSDDKNTEGKDTPTESGNAAGDDPATGGQAEADKKSLMLSRLYLKDFSFESPKSPSVLQISSWEPQLNLKLGTSFFETGEDFYEVILHLSVEAQAEGEVAFLCELQQAGWFQLKGFNGEELERVVGTVCAHILFPYAREAIGSMVAKGSFPQILLQPVNFEELYLKRLQDKQAAAASGSAVPGMPDIPGVGNA